MSTCFRIDLRLGLAALLAAALAACGGEGATENVDPGDATGNYPAGQTDFVSASPNGGDVYAPGRGETDNGAGGAGAPSDGGGVQRAIEEADVVRLDGRTLYVLNQYRGLQIIDLTVRDAPVIAGSAPIRGYPVEMYVRGSRAYVVTSNYYDFWYGAETDAAVETFRGSMIVVVDVSNAANPVILGRIPVEGYVTDTRIVGDVLYAVSNRYAWYDNYATQDDGSETVILSIDVSNPAAARVVDTERFPLDEYGWNNHVHVTPTTIHVATPYYDSSSSTYQLKTRLQVVDISDPAGQIVLRGQATVNGMVPSRWGLDEYQGVLRVVTGPGWGNGAPELTTFEVSAAGALTRLGGLTVQLPRPESLTAVRFDGVRGYVVTFERVDPLFLLDLTNPAAPLQVGELEMPGWLDHIVPKGNKLIALGHDNSNSAGEWRLAVSLFDVTSLAGNPVLLDRVEFGAGWGWVPDDVDDRDKVFKVLDALGLVMVPFQSYGQDRSDGRWWHVGGVQLVEFDANLTDLTKRGLIEGGGFVRRALVDGDRILTVGSEQLQVVEFANRDAPVVKATVDLARNVTEFAVVNGVGVQLVGDWWSGDTRLVVVPLTNPDLGPKLAELQITAPYARMFVDGAYVYLVSNDWQTGQATVRVVDFTTPTAPALRGAVDLPFVSYWWYGCYWYSPWYYGGDEVVQLDGDKLVFHVRPYSYWYYEDGGRNGQQPPENERLYVVDLARKSAPAIASVIDLPTTVRWAYGLFAHGDVLHFSHLEDAGQDPSGRPVYRYYLDRIDLSTPARPRTLQKLNVPGYVLGVNAAGDLAYTLDVSYWSATSGQPDYSVAPRYTLNTVTLTDRVAILRDRLTLNDDRTWVNQVKVRGPTAVMTAYRTWNDAEGWHSENRLAAIDVSDPTDLVLGPSLQSPQYGWLAELAGGRAFYNVSWPGGLAVYAVRGASGLALESFTPVEGWVSQIRVHGSTAYVATGYWGVHAIPFGVTAP